MPPKITEESRTERLTVYVTPELKAKLNRARETNGSTMNGEIHTRLDASFDDPTQQLASATWLMLRKLDDDDRSRFVDMIGAMARKSKR